MSDFKRIKGKVHFHVSGLAGAVQTSDALSQHKHNQTIPNIYTQYSHVQDRTSSLALFS